jgi:hypothetical protein
MSSVERAVFKMWHVEYDVQDSLTLSRDCICCTMDSVKGGCYTSENRSTCKAVSVSVQNYKIIQTDKMCCVEKDV